MVHVICCNDSIEKVVIGSESFAQQECVRMKDEGFKSQYDSGTSDYNEYTDRYFWHVHENVDMIEED